MNHFYTNIYGHFDFEHVYHRMVTNADSGAHFVEVGSFYGKSTAFMCVEIVNSGKNIRFDAIDTWLGSPEHQKGQWAETSDCVNGTLYEAFLYNMEPVKGVYNPIRMDSIEASKLYADHSLDFVFIDATHEYEFVKADILAWTPKVKLGGFIGGHDYARPTDPWFNWPGVYRAVSECFNVVENCRGSWMRQIT